MTPYFLEVTAARTQNDFQSENEQLHQDFCSSRGCWHHVWTGCFGQKIRLLPRFGRFWCILMKLPPDWNIQKLVWFTLDSLAVLFQGHPGYQVILGLLCCCQIFKETLGSQSGSQQQMTFSSQYIPGIKYLSACIYSKWTNFVGTYFRIGTSGFS